MSLENVQTGDILVREDVRRFTGTPEVKVDIVEVVSTDSGVVRVKGDFAPGAEREFKAIDGKPVDVKDEGLLREAIPGEIEYIRAAVDAIEDSYAKPDATEEEVEKAKRTFEHNESRAHAYISRLIDIKGNQRYTAKVLEVVKQAASFQDALAELT